MEKWNDSFGIWTRDLQHWSQVSLPLHYKIIREIGKRIYRSHYSVAESGKKLLIFKAGNSNQDKFKTLKAPRMHIFQVASKTTFEFTS